MLALTEPLHGAFQFIDLAKNKLPLPKAGCDAETALSPLTQLMALRVLPPALHPQWYAAALLLMQLNTLTQEKVDRLMVLLGCDHPVVLDTAIWIGIIWI